MKRTASKIARLAAVIFLIGCLFSLSALAETAFVLGAAHVYAQPSASARSVRVKAGKQVEVIAEKDGWAQVRLKGKIGYMQVDDLAKVTNYSGETVYALQKAPVYKNHSASSKKLGVVAAGTALKLRAAAGDWAYVELGGKRGYIRRDLLTTEAPEAAEPAEEPETSALRMTAYAAKDGAKVYSDGASGANLLTTLALNAAVTVTGVRDGWCRVEANGVTAYMRLEDLSEEKVKVPETREEAPEEAAASALAELEYGDKGDAVKALQTRLKELGFFTGNIGGNYLEQTQSALSAFQEAAKLPVTGKADAATLRALASDSAPRADASTGGKSTVSPARGTAREMDWWSSGIQTIFARETIAQVTDIETGLSWRVIRKGGANHADVQPLTAADTAAMKRACGGWSWNRRAIWVTIDGVNYAASMNCMPHGSGSITTNNFPGHHCIHFTNSRTHGTNRVCPQHQAAIKVAAAAKR